MKETQATSVRFEPPALDRVKAAAKKLHWSVSDLLATLACAYVDYTEKTGHFEIPEDWIKQRLAFSTRIDGRTVEGREYERKKRTEKTYQISPQSAVLNDDANSILSPEQIRAVEMVIAATDPSRDQSANPKAPQIEPPFPTAGRKKAAPKKCGNPPY